MSAPTTRPNARPARDLLAGEEGMLSLASLFVLLGFLVLIGLLANVGLVTARKVETQNAADSAAYSASVEMARGMNAVTAVNHLVGELTALVILIHTLGGPPLDGTADPPPTPQDVKDGLTFWHDLAKAFNDDSGSTIPLVPDVYDSVKDEPAVDGAIWDSRVRLKKVLTWAYQLHYAGGVIEKGKSIPIIGPVLEGIGVALEGLAAAFEGKVLQEWKTLDVLEALAKNVLQPVKTALKTTVIPGLHRYSGALAWAAPVNARAAAGRVGEANGAEGTVFPLLPTLPLRQEPGQLKNWTKSQLVRASTPWVQWWRQPWMDFGKKVLILSRFACAFRQRSTDYTRPITDELKQQHGVNLYVLDGLDLDGAGKTNEPWTYAGNSRQADRMFAVVGLAHRAGAPVASGGVFRRESPDGLVCYAQAMVYNANAQKRGSGDGNTQPTAGWDTLNWAVPVPEHPGPVPGGDDCPTPNTPQPLVRLNWQAKLVPISRLEEAIAAQPETIAAKPNPIRRVLDRMLPGSNLSRTH